MTRNNETHHVDPWRTDDPRIPCGLGRWGSVSVTEVTQFERRMEAFFNSPQFRKDPSLVMRYYDASDSMHMFDIMEPGEFAGEAFRKHFIEVSNAMTGTLEYRNLNVYANSGLAFAYYTQHYVGQDKAGNRIEIFAPTTDCLRKSRGQWHIVHMHESMVMDGATFAALMKQKK
jgi:ketosteroid isomerase-like protein